MPPGLDRTRLLGNCGLCCGEVILGEAEVKRPDNDGDADGPTPPGLKGLSSMCGVPILGDDCIVLYGDIALAWLFGLCKTELMLAEPGDCVIIGLGECNGLCAAWIMGLFSGDCTECCIMGEGDISGDWGAVAGDDPGLEMFLLLR